MRKFQIIQSEFLHSDFFLTLIFNQMKNNTFTYIISYEGQEKHRFENQESDQKAFIKLLRSQGNSIDYALRHGGWKVEVINEQTNESEFWKPYSRS